MVMEKKKVLWVCNIMLPIIARELGVEGSNKEGWLSGLCDIILERQQENGIELHVAYPVGQEQDGTVHTLHTVKGTLYAYGFYEDVNHAECYDDTLEERLRRIIRQVNPDVVHCFGTEYGHTLAVVRCLEDRSRVLIGMQGVCQEIARAYMADLPEEVQASVTFRDWLKKDSMKEQQQKFVLRGKREAEILALAGNVTGRTEFDRKFVNKCNMKANYFSANETLRACFYQGQWHYEECEPHTIFLSQGDYPLKGLHYLLLAAGRLKEKYPDLKIHIAGNSLVNYHTLKDKIKISGYGKYLRKLIQQNGLEECVCFLGSLKAEEMKAQYLKCGLYVCCSSNENSPNSLGEAMLLGVPCVAANVGGIPSLFVDKKDGILYQGHGKSENSKNNMCYKKEAVNSTESTPEYAQPEEEQNMSNVLGLERISYNLECAIDEMWSNVDKMQEFCKNARKHARCTHDKEMNYIKMMEIYAEIANAER